MERYVRVLFCSISPSGQVRVMCGESNQHNISLQKVTHWKSPSNIRTVEGKLKLCSTIHRKIKDPISYCPVADCQ